jgi:hypothetical protein
MFVLGVAPDSSSEVPCDSDIVKLVIVVQRVYAAIVWKNSLNFTVLSLQESSWLSLQVPFDRWCLPPSPSPSLPLTLAFSIVQPDSLVPSGVAHRLYDYRNLTKPLIQSDHQRVNPLLLELSRVSGHASSQLSLDRVAACLTRVERDE